MFIKNNIFPDGFLSAAAHSKGSNQLEHVVNWKQVVAKYAAMQGLFEGPVFSAHKVEEPNDDSTLDNIATMDEKATKD